MNTLPFVWSRAYRRTPVDPDLAQAIQDLAARIEDLRGYL